MENNKNLEGKELAYIEPNLSVYDTLEELLSDKNYDGNFSFLEKKHVFRHSELLQGGSFFVLGEPGSGKTTLLNQIILNAEKEQLFAKKLLLTSTRPEELEATLTEVYNEASQKRLVFEFDNYIFCLDGLDEVNSEIFSEMINEIIRFNKIYPKFKLIISCRTHYLSKSLGIIRAATDFKFVKIQPFTSNQIIEYIKIYAGEDYANAFSTKINNYHRDDFNSILRVPRYLDIQIKVAKESNSVREFGEMKRADFFEKFIYQKLEKEEGKQEKNVLTKRVLEKLALIMEIYQVNKITKDELITFLDEADSNINLIFLNTESIDSFISRVLKSTDLVIEFDNTEFQEYLAAKELLRLGQKSQILFDLIVEPNFKQIFPNWFDVLKYVVEIDPSQLVNILEFLKHRIDRLVSDDIFTLLASVDVKKLSIKQRSTIFEIVHDYFQKHSLFIWKHASILTEFYTDDNEALFNIEIFAPYSTRISNQLYLLSYLLERKLFKPITKLVENVKANIVSESNTDLIMQFISILEKSNSWDALVEVNSVKDKNDEIFKSFFRAAFEINTNHEFCLNLLFEAIGRKVEEVVHYFNEISDPLLVKKMIQTMTTDLTILESFIERTEHYYPREYYKVFRVIDEIWDSEINILLLKQHEYLLVNTNEYELRNVNYFKELVACLSRHNEDFLKTFLSLREPFVYFGFFDIVYNLVNETNVIYFKGYSATPGGSNLLYQLFNNMKISDSTKYAILKTFLQEESDQIYRAVEAYIPDKKSTDDQIVEDFYRQLEPKPGHYNFGVFNILLKNKDLILTQVSSEKLDLLKTIILNIFQKTDADLLKIKITSMGEGRSYNISNKYVYEYPTYLEAALVLGMKDDVQFARESFIKLLPLNEDSSKTKIISDFIGDISQEEITLFADYCKKRSDDFLRVFASNFMRVVKDHKVIALLPMVKSLLMDTSTYPHEKVTAIQCIAEVESSKDSLVKYFSDFIALTDGFRYAETANECLILRHGDKDAIRWRLDELKKRKFKFVKSYAPGMRPYTDGESELDRGTFANCLIGLRNFELMQDFNELLSISFELRSDKDYHEYSSYLQRIVFNYYKDLKHGNSISPLKALTGFYDSNTSLYKISFKDFLRDLEVEYSQSVLKPDNIFDCVKKYNSLKKNTYLPISNDFELLNILRDTINEDLNNFISNEGFYKPIKKDMTEDMMQKILKVQIENSLYKKGFRMHDIYREPQLHNDKRPDFVISYGFIGPIVVELKFISNPEISNATKRSKYKVKLENNYRRGFNAKYGIYLVLEKDKRNRSVLKQKLSSEYSDLKEWHIHFLKCYQD